MRRDDEFDAQLARVLRAGVMLSAAIVAIGAVIFLVRHGAERPLYSVFRGEPADLRTIRGIVADARHWSGRAWIQLGLLVLIGTPIARVVFSVFGFIRERDWLYVAVTSVVLALLLFALLGS